MSKSIRNAILIGVLLAASETAWSQTAKWYVGGSLGVASLNDVDVTQAGLDFTTDFDLGQAFSLSGGRIFRDFRAEGELFVSASDFSSLSSPGLGSASASGTLTTMGLMLNGYYDFPTDSKWKPYIGAGIGFTEIDIDSLAANGVFIASDNDHVFAYQAKAGIAYRITPAVDVSLGYRYFATGDADFTDVTGTDFSADGAQLHAVEVGLRYRW